MRLQELFEGRWWDASPTVTLYHGTSSALLPAIREHGLLPPPGEVRDYVRAVLLDLLPEADWPEGIVEEMSHRISRSRTATDRTTSGSRSLYFFAADREDTPSVRGYARSYAQFGGEIAYDVWSWLNALRKDGGQPPLPPRWPDGVPVVVEVEVPREWCLWNTDIDAARDRLVAAWDRQVRAIMLDDDGQPYPSRDAMLDDAMRNREVRVACPVPATMIRRVHPVRPIS